MREARREPDPDHALHVLNTCWSLGFQRGLEGIGPEIAEVFQISGPGESAAMREQYYMGLRDGRRLRDAMKESINDHDARGAAAAPEADDAPAA